MQIRSLAITQRPVWFDVTGRGLEKLVFRAKKRFWPAGVKAAALFLFEFEDDAAPEELLSSSIASGSVGPYVYLDPDGKSQEFEQIIYLPTIKLKRIGIRLWNVTEPVLLEDITIETVGGEVESEHAAHDEVVLNDSKEFADLATSSSTLGLNLLTSNAECTARCHAICKHWYNTMDEVARRYPKDEVGRTNGLLDVGAGVKVPVTAFHGQPAMLRIPADFDSYLEIIGDKSRNMIRKARRMGYVYKKVDPDLYLDDVLTIRTSNPLRQGRPIPDYFKVRPTQMIEEFFRNGCARHGQDFYGLFKDDQLVAYTTIFFYGELGQVNHILGHADHLNEGIMNLLISETVCEITQSKPWVKAINYLYPDAVKTNSGLGLFKRSSGFFPSSLVITQSDFDLHRYFEDRTCDVPVAKEEAGPDKKVSKAGMSKAVREAVRSDDLIRLEKVKDRDSAVDAALKELEAREARLKVVRFRLSQDEAANEQFDALDRQALVFEHMNFEGYQDFLSSQLKSFRKSVPKDSYLLFDFKRSPDKAYLPNTRGLARLIPPALQGRGRRVNQSLTEYLSKRFKSLDMSVDDIKLGFKGSDYVVAGLVDYGHKPSYRDFDSLLILRKIR
jgi:hypothetical protein